jgi:hypothetical protein
VLRRSLTALVCAAAVGAIAATADASTSGIVAFRTPSGNIGCIASTGPTYLRCDIKSGLRPRPPKPSDCRHLAWGDSLGMTGTGRPIFVCHGDTVFVPSARVVAYGHTIKVGPFRCTSQSSGLTCRNRAGHGWFLSRTSYRRY